MKQLVLNKRRWNVTAEIDDQTVTFTGYSEVYHKDAKVTGKLVPVWDKKIQTCNYLAWKRPFIAHKASIEIFDNMVKVKVSGNQPEHLEQSRRGEVSLDFSGKKRKRFLDAMNAWRIQPGSRMYMVTLTYPDQFPRDWVTWKDDLERFRERLLAIFPDVEGFWRLELIDRKSGINRGLIAPHYHLILATFTDITTKQFRKWCNRIWSKIAHEHDKFQGRNSTRVDRILTPRHALNYAAKYCTKYSAAPVTPEGEIMGSEYIQGTVGRQWGKIGSPNCQPSQIWTVSRTVAQVLFDSAVRLKFEAGDSWKGLFKQNALSSWTAYNIGDNPKTHERYHRPALPPAYDLLVRAVKNAGKAASVRKEPMDWDAPLTDEMCL